MPDNEGDVRDAPESYGYPDLGFEPADRVGWCPGSPRVCDTSFAAGGRGAPIRVARRNRMGTTERNAVTISGAESGRPMMFAHGYGCDQNMWRFVTPAFQDTHRIVLFDHVGNG